MTELYREQGFLQAEVRFERLRVDVPRRTADASFSVVEGPQVLASEVKAEGGPDTFAALPKVPLKVGDPLSPDAVEQGRQAMLAELAREGYLFARVDADLRLERPEAARILYRLEPGPQVKVGRVLIQGLGRTESEVVRATLRVKEDTVLDPEAMLREPAAAGAPQHLPERHRAHGPAGGARAHQGRGGGGARAPTHGG
jgi:outer membrane protein assembly factor BamA